MRRHPAAHSVTIGIDVGGTNIRAARIGRDGRMTDHRTVRTASGAAVAEVVRELSRGLLDDAVEAIGIGIPGRLDRSGDTVLSAGFVELSGLGSDTILGARLDRPVVLGNDAHMALLAELQLGAAQSAEDVVMFTVGTGIGGAVAVERRLVRGRGNAGQLGHLTLDPAGPRCNCGRRGCSETLASGTALARAMREAGLPDGTSAEWLLERRAADPVAGTVLRRWARAWRHAIDTVVAMFDPDLVVLGGGLGAAAVAALEAYEPSTVEWFACPVVAARLNDDAGVIGAGLRAFDAI
jgi:glucokinase